MTFVICILVATKQSQPKASQKQALSSCVPCHLGYKYFCLLIQFPGFHTEKHHLFRRVSPQILEAIHFKPAPLKFQNKDAADAEAKYGGHTQGRFPTPPHHHFRAGITALSFQSMHLLLAMRLCLRAKKLDKSLDNLFFEPKNSGHKELTLHFYASRKLPGPLVYLHE